MLCSIDYQSLPKNPNIKHILTLVGNAVPYEIDYSVNYDIVQAYAYEFEEAKTLADVKKIKKRITIEQAINTFIEAGYQIDRIPSSEYNYYVVLYPELPVKEERPEHTKPVIKQRPLSYFFPTEACA